MATLRLSRGSEALYTSPMPSCTDRRLDFVGPSFVPEDKAIRARDYMEEGLRYQCADKGVRESGLIGSH